MTESAWSPVAGASQILAQRPEVARFWIGRRFRNWQLSPMLWTNLATRSIGVPGTGGELPALEGDRSQLLYVPPVDPELASVRSPRQAWLADSKFSMLVQAIPGDPFAPPETATVVYDLLLILLDGDLDRIETLPSGATVVWPLIAGMSDDPILWREGCGRLQAAGVQCAQALRPDLDGRDRRCLAAELEARGRSDFDALFHRSAPSERDFAAVADRFGLAPFMRRPLLPVEKRRARNHRVAETLSLTAEIWLGLERSEAQAQLLFQAARWAEETSVDVRALGREGNLEILDWLRPPASTVVEEWASSGTSATFDALLAEYLGRVGQGESDGPD